MSNRAKRNRPRTPNLGVSVRRSILTGGDDSEVSATETTLVATTVGAEVDVYLDAVSAAEGEWRAAFERLDEVLSHTYATRGALFLGVEDAGFPEATATILSRAKELKPPEPYTADHEIWLDYRRTLTSLDQALEDAIESSNITSLLEVIP